MRVLNIKTGLVEGVRNPLTCKYAILSHTWGDEEEEVSFSDMKSPDFKAKKGYEKIEMASKLAEQDGLSYVWIDTCCIDRSSSAELTEAINSMYRWYERSVVCYAYLSDIPPHQPLDLSLQHSRWVTRGWTLQELIAPKKVYFFDMNWNRRGSKEDLIEELSQITKISRQVLKHEQPLSDVTVAQKMSWAAGRQTTRVEDQAYCLLGIFDVNMPLLYGEEEKAFRRLQYEIIGRTADLSIFAWSLPLDIRKDEEGRLYCGVLAASPNAFAECTTLSRLPHRIHRDFSVSNNGIRTQIHVLSYPIPGKRGAYAYVLPLDCVEDAEADTSLGILLRKCGPDIFVREDPYTLFRHKQSLEPNTPRARYLLTELPGPDLQKDLYGIYSSRMFATMRQHVLQIRLPPEVELWSVWPWSRYDEEDNLFLVSGEPRYDGGTIRLRVTLPIPNPGSIIDCMFYAVGWSSLEFNSLQYSFVNYREHNAAVGEIDAQLSAGDYTRHHLLYVLDAERVPRFQNAAIKVPGTNLFIYLSVEPTLRRDASICCNEFWRFTFSYKIYYKYEDVPAILPLEWAVQYAKE
ncbi:HET-domain-containing protein [Nemania sp. FL0031]|nr:HET-domain-containing protein [Nemania sp. FL0031]